MIEVKLKKIKTQIDFQQNVNKLIKEAVFEAAQINVKDIKRGLDTSKGPRGPIKRLKPSTIRLKRKKGQSYSEPC